MNAFEELSLGGELGPEGYGLFISRARRAVRSRGYPPPGGASRWTEEHLVELVHDIFVSKGPKLTLALLEAVDLDSLERLVTVIVQNFLVDQAKLSEIGKLRSRLTGLLTSDDLFVEVGSNRWGLTDGPQEPSGVSLSALARAACAVRGVRLQTPLNTSGPTSRANAEALCAVAAAVLGTARGAVGAQDLTRAVAARFDLLPAPVTPFDGVEDRMVGDTDVGSSETTPVDRVIAEQLLASLTAVEREAVGFLADGASATALASRLGCGRRQAAAVIERVREKVRLATPHDEDLLGIMHALVALLTARPGPPVTERSSVSGESTGMSMSGRTSERRLRP